eukprot:763919-Hanusia_phi.AAC.2
MGMCCVLGVWRGGRRGGTNKNIVFVATCEGGEGERRHAEYELGWGGEKESKTSLGKPCKVAIALCRRMGQRSPLQLIEEHLERTPRMSGQAQTA